MSYVSAHLHYNDVLVVERSAGKRRIVKHRAPYFMYVEDPAGSATTMFGTAAKRLDFSRRRDMRDEREDLNSRGVRTFESDIKPEYKVLEASYKGKPAPTLNTAFIDIEVLSRAKEGWARWNNPYAPISAVSIHRRWIGDTVTLALLPDDGRTYKEAEEQLAGIPDTIIFDSEVELLDAMLELLEDCDVVTGWNSYKFDVPYIVARLRIVLGGQSPDEFVDDDNERDEDVPTEVASVLRRLSPLSLPPRRRLVDSFGSKETVFDIPGRPHLDYLDLYKKFEINPRESYKLGYILWHEVKQTKVEYTGTLESLYYDDFRTYILYNRQDVDGLVALDDKLGFIEVANIMAHMSCVFLEDSMGSVSKIEQAMVMKLHEMGMVAQDKPFAESDGPVAGALVFDPQPGLHDWMATLDVKSLYPSVIRMLNMSPETLIGQFDLTKTNRAIASLVSQGLPRAEAWARFTNTIEYGEIVEGDEFSTNTLDLVDGTKITKTSAEWKEIFEAGGMSLSANGTVFDLSREGLIPLVLTGWFEGRKEDQKKAAAAAREIEAMLSECPIVEMKESEASLEDDED